MSLIRRIARPLIAAPFILEGVRTTLHPQREIDAAPAAFGQVDKALASSAAPSVIDARTIVRAAGVVATGAGILYAAGKAPRASALVLLATTSVGLANRKKVWQLRGEERLQEIQSILTDAGLLGGVLLAVADTDGSPSLRYRFDRLVERGQRSAARKQRALEKSASSLRTEAGKKVDEVARAVHLDRG